MRVLGAPQCERSGCGAEPGHAEDGASDSLAMKISKK